MIYKYRDQFSVKLMCRVLLVSCSGYYDWCNRSESKHSIENKRLEALIQEAFVAERSPAGSVRIAKKLKAGGETIGRHRVAKIMQKLGLRAKAAKKFKATTNSNHKLPVAPNLLKQNFTADKPNEKWVSDISVPQQAA